MNDLRIKKYFPTLELFIFLVISFALLSLALVGDLNLVVASVLAILADLIILNQCFVVFETETSFTLIPLSPLEKKHHILKNKLIMLKSIEESQIEFDEITGSAFPVFTRKYALRFGSLEGEKQVVLRLSNKRLIKTIQSFVRPIND